jgi:tetratricopeptide (TPR) repeat protein
LLEKKGDYIGALENYRRNAETWPSRETRALYEDADRRLVSHIASLKSSGRTAEAAALETRRTATRQVANANIPMQWQASFDAGWAAWKEGRLDETEKAWKTALALAEKLQPLDDRVTSSLLQLSSLYLRQQRFADADANSRRALSVAEQIHGPGSAETMFALMSIGRSFEEQHQTAQAEAYYLRTLKVVEKYFGQQNFNVAMVLGSLSALYYNQRQFDKAEPLFRRQLEMEEARVGADNFEVVAAVEPLGRLYMAWGKYDKAEPYYRRVLALKEKQFGPNDAGLTSTLVVLAALKRNMGDAEAARQLDQRREALGAAVSTRK